MNEKFDEELHKILIQIKLPTKYLLIANGKGVTLQWGRLEDTTLMQ